MSFGYGIGDIITVTTLALKAVQNTRQACGQYDELTREVTSLHIVLSRLQHEAETPSSLLLQLSNNEKQELSYVVNSCGEILKVLNAILEKYGMLIEEKRSVTKLWQRVRFGNGEMQDLSMIRGQLSGQTASLALFLHLVSLGSQGRVEREMARQMGALQELQHSIDLKTSTAPAVITRNRESSILTTYENDDKDFWKEFRRELIAEGCSSEVMARHRDLVVNYVRELESNGGVETGLEVESIPSLDELPSDSFSTAIFDFDNEVVKSRIYTRVLASASVRNSLTQLPNVLALGDESADWPLPATPLPGTVVSSRAESIQPKTGMPDVEYKPPASSLQVLPSTSTSRKDSPKEVSRSKHSPSRPLGSQVSPTIQPRTNPKLQKPQKPPNSNKHKTSVTSTQAEEIRLAGKTDALHKKWLEEYKLVVMGGGGADKSSFVIQLIQSHFVDEYDPTIEDSYRKQCVIDDRVALLDVLDTAGQEEYSAMRAQYMKTGEGFVLMYSITSRTSLDDACALYTELLRVKNKDYSPIILVGNHCERENERQISKQEGETLARSWGCPFVEASAKERINVEKAFYDLVREIRRYIRSELQAISHKRIQDMKEQESPPRGGLKEFLVRRRRP